MLAFHDRLTLYCGVVPVPARDSTTLEMAPLLVNDSDPETAPLAVGVKPTLNDMLCPAGIVKGREAPLSENCELLKASEETVTFAPLALMVMACVPVEPTFTLPKFNEDGLMLNCPPVVVVPLPLKDTLTFESDALLANCSDPLAVPLAVGLKTTLNIMLCPAAIVSGSDPGPFTVNCGLLLRSEDTVTLAPLAVNVSDCVPVEPTFTLPKFKVDGKTLNWPAVFAAVPLPLRGMFNASFEMKRLPALMPADDGLKPTFTVTLCPARRITGNAGPLTVNPLPVAFQPEICTL